MDHKTYTVRHHDKFARCRMSALLSFSTCIFSKTRCVKSRVPRLIHFTQNADHDLDLGSIVPGSAVPVDAAVDTCASIDTIALRRQWQSLQLKQKTGMRHSVWLHSILRLARLSAFPGLTGCWPEVASRKLPRPTGTPALDLMLLPLCHVAGRGVAP